MDRLRGQAAKSAISMLSGYPVESITESILLVQTDAGTQMVHSLCCNPHAAQALRQIAHQIDLVAGYQEGV